MVYSINVNYTEPIDSVVPDTYILKDFLSLLSVNDLYTSTESSLIMALSISFQHYHFAPLNFIPCSMYTCSGLLYLSLLTPLMKQRSFYSLRFSKTFFVQNQFGDYRFISKVSQRSSLTPHQI